MTIISFILVIIFLILVPFIIGLLGERLFIKKGGSLVFSRCFAVGFAIMLALFQAVAPFMILKGTSFDALLYLYTAAILILIIISLVINGKTLFSRIRNSIRKIADNIKSADKEYVIVGIIALALIVLQVSLLAFRMHTDTDDARFIAEALEAVENNTLLRLHPITGEVLSQPIGEMTKDITSPYPIWIAVMSVLTAIKPAILAHLVFPVLLIPLSYSVIYLLGTHFFDDINKRFVYIFITSVAVLFSFESVYAWGYTLLTIIWQGRSIAAVLMIPLLWYVMMKILTDENAGYGLFFAAAIIGLANADLSGMGALMTPLVGGGFAASYFISNKKIIPTLLIVLSVIPAGVFAVIYMGLW